MTATSHTVGEGMAYFRWKSLSGCMLSRCWSCNVEWDSMQRAHVSDDLVAGESK